MNTSESFHVKQKNGSVMHYTKKEFIQYLVDKGQTKRYQDTSKKFKAEVKETECPCLYKTKNGYIYTVI